MLRGPKVIRQPARLPRFKHGERLAFPAPSRTKQYSIGRVVAIVSITNNVDGETYAYGFESDDPIALAALWNESFLRRPATEEFIAAKLHPGPGGLPD